MHYFSIYGAQYAIFLYSNIHNYSTCLYILDSAFIPASENKDKYGHLLRSLNLKPSAIPTLFLDDLDDEDQTKPEPEINEFSDNQENDDIISVKEELTNYDVENLREIENDLNEETNNDISEEFEAEHEKTSEEIIISPEIYDQLPPPEEGIDSSNPPNHEPEVNKQLTTTGSSPPRKRERGGMRVPCPECQVQIHPHSLTRHITKVHRTSSGQQDTQLTGSPSADFLSNRKSITPPQVQQYRVSCPQCHIQIHPNSLTRHLVSKQIFLEKFVKLKLQIMYVKFPSN